MQAAQGADREEGRARSRSSSGHAPRVDGDPSHVKHYIGSRSLRIACVNSSRPAPRRLRVQGSPKAPPAWVLREWCARAPLRGDPFRSPRAARPARRVPAGTGSVLAVAHVPHGDRGARLVPGRINVSDRDQPCGQRDVLRQTPQLHHAVRPKGPLDYRCRELAESSAVMQYQTATKRPLDEVISVIQLLPGPRLVEGVDVDLSGEIRGVRPRPDHVIIEVADRGAPLACRGSRKR